MRNTLTIGLAVTLLGGALAGCAYNGDGLDNPIGRRSVWLSYLAGDDIKEGCAAGAPDRYRLVYNGRWMEQVRTYDLGQSGPHTLDQRVIGPAELSHFTLNEITAPWTGKTARTELAPGQYAQLAAAIDASGFAGPAPVGERYASDSFYWVAAACRGGVFHLNAWQFDTPRFTAISFDRQLLAADQTGIAFNEPHALDSLDFSDKHRTDRERWYIQIYADGLSGGTGP